MAIPTQAATTSPTTEPARTAGRRRPNIPAGVLSTVWLLIVMVPIYWVVITSFKSSADYYRSNPMVPPTDPTLENYRLVIASDFVQYFVNSVVVSVGAVLPAVLMSFMCAFAIVRGGTGRFLRGVNALFLMGLAIPLQATIIPVYLIIIQIGLYDTLRALILPSMAFALPLTILILSNFIRDVPNELFESMRLDGATEWGTMWRLAFPLTKPALVTVTIYQALVVWNAFLLPLVLTQSPDKRVLPLALWSFQGQYSVNIPAVLASVILTTLPILVLYVLGRRQLLSGLTAGFTK